MIPHSKPTLGPEEAAAVEQVLHSGRLAQSEQVAAFERECAETLGRTHAVAVSSGTAALHLALSAVGVERDEPVALPSYACAALPTAVTLQQGRVALCDVGDDFNLDLQTLPAGARVTILPHLFGAPARAPAAGVVIEDIAQSIGGETGRNGPVAVTSFYATKLLTTGEGGMLFADDAGIADHARDRRDYDKRDDFVPRFPYKMTDFQAAMGRVQLRKLPGFVARRREIAGQYTATFRDLPLRLPSAGGHVFFRYVIETDRRDALQRHLHGAGIEAVPPVHRPAHHYFGGDFPRSEAAHLRCLSLPIYPSLLDDEIQRVIVSVLRFFD